VIPYLSKDSSVSLTVKRHKFSMVILPVAKWASFAVSHVRDMAKAFPSSVTLLY
jgi:hypothetical protein